MVNMKVRVGVPINPIVYYAVKNILEKGGVFVDRPPRRCIVETDKAIFVYARLEEIVRLMAEGNLDAGFVTKDYWHGFYPFVKTRDTLSFHMMVFEEFQDFCKCSLAFISNISKAYWYVHEVDDSPIHNIIAGFIGIMRRNPVIVTRFSEFTERFLNENKFLHKKLKQRRDSERDNAESYWVEVREVHGDEELYVVLGHADFGVVRVETGATVRENRLWAVGHMMESHLMFVGRPSEKVEEFLSLLRLG